jgi:hypothetical protein
MKTLSSVIADQANSDANPFNYDSRSTVIQDFLFLYDCGSIANKEDHLDSNNSDLNFQKKQIRNIPGTNFTCEDSTPSQKK